MEFSKITYGTPCTYLDVKRRPNEGIILGANTGEHENFAWALIYNLKCVFQFDPDEAVVDANGTVLFDAPSRQKSIKMVKEGPVEGDVNTWIFHYAVNPQRLLALVKVHVLSARPAPGDRDSI